MSGTQPSFPEVHFHACFPSEVRSLQLWGPLALQAFALCWLRAPVDAADCIPTPPLGNRGSRGLPLAQVALVCPVLMIAHLVLLTGQVAAGGTSVTDDLKLESSGSQKLC